MTSCVEISLSKFFSEEFIATSRSVTDFSRPASPSPIFFSLICCFAWNRDSKVPLEKLNYYDKKSSNSHRSLHFDKGILSYLGQQLLFFAVFLYASISDILRSGFTHALLSLHNEQAVHKNLAKDSSWCPDEDKPPWRHVGSCDSSIIYHHLQPLSSPEFVLLGYQQ